MADAISPAASKPSLPTDFTRLMGWLSHDVAQGLAFNAGSTFDPPREVTDRRIQPDLSLGVGHMPLDKKNYPQFQTTQLSDGNVFPSAVNFPNLVMHLRMGLPGRMDLSLRLADMTTPSGYQLSKGTPASGQSNSVGFSVRRHFLGGEEMPLLSIGANYNNVYGKFSFLTTFPVSDPSFGTADTDVKGSLQWNVNSYGLTAVLSQAYGRWTPFAGFGANYITGSVRTRIDASPHPPGVFPTPFDGEGSSRPQQAAGRAIVGFQMNHSWANFFANGEIKAAGLDSGSTWIVQTGFTLPFAIGPRSSSLAKKEARRREMAERNNLERRESRGSPETADAYPELMFVQ
jgi:hypothetical protein